MILMCCVTSQPEVVVVNQSCAAHYWGRPLGEALLPELVQYQQLELTISQQDYRCHLLTFIFDSLGDVNKLVVRGLHWTSTLKQYLVGVSVRSCFWVVEKVYFRRVDLFSWSWRCIVFHPRDFFSPNWLESPRHYSSPVAQIQLFYLNVTWMIESLQIERPPIKSAIILSTQCGEGVFFFQPIECYSVSVFKSPDCMSE